MVATFRKGEPRAWWGRATKRGGPLGSEELTAKSASSASRGAQEAMEREQIVVAAKLSVAVGLNRILRMRWEST